MSLFPADAGRAVNPTRKTRIEASTDLAKSRLHLMTGIEITKTRIRNWHPRKPCGLTNG